MSDELRSLAAKYKLPMPKSLGSQDVIMVVEDQMDLRQIVVHQLKKINFSTVVHCGNGYEAVELMREENIQPKAFIVDMDMPVMAGLDFLSELRENTNLIRGPFILAMDAPSKEKIMLAVEHGVDVILSKPFTLGDIGPKLRTAFERFHNPQNPEKLYELAKAALREQKLDVAAKVYQELAAAAPKAARPKVGLARVARAQGKLSEAMSLLNEAEQRNPNFVHTFAERGGLYVQQENWGEATKAFEAAIKLSPLNAMRYKSAADILFRTNRYQDAAGLLDQALKHELEFPELYNYLSKAHYALKDYAKAARYIRTALNGQPDNVAFLNQLGICLKELDQLDDALKAYNKSIKLDPDNKAALYNKAILCQKRGQPEEGVKLLERLLKKHPDFSQGRSKLAELQKEVSGSAA